VVITPGERYTPDATPVIISTGGSHMARPLAHTEQNWSTAEAIVHKQLPQAAVQK